MTQTQANASAGWVALAVFAQPHGVSGRIKVKSFTDPEDAFAEHALLMDESGKTYKITITGHVQGMAIVNVEGITDRNAAALLCGKRIGVAREALPELKSEGQYYTDDLVGATVTTVTGEKFGTVAAVVNYGASDILEVTRPDGSSELFAFTHAIFPIIDVNARQVTIDPPVILNARVDDESA